MSVFTVPASKADCVRKWVADGRGIRLWKSADLSTMRPDQITPGDVTSPPHWAYTLADSAIVAPAEIAVEKRLKIPGMKDNVRVKREWWGYDVTSKDRLNSRAAKIGEKIGKTVDWFVEWSEFGISRIGFHVVEKSAL